MENNSGAVWLPVCIFFVLFPGLLWWVPYVVAPVVLLALAWYAYTIASGVVEATEGLWKPLVRVSSTLSRRALASALEATRTGRLAFCRHLAALVKRSRVAAAPPTRQRAGNFAQWRRQWLARWRGRPLPAAERFRR